MNLNFLCYCLELLIVCNNVVLSHLQKYIKGNDACLQNMSTQHVTIVLHMEFYISVLTLFFLTF